MGGLVTDSGTGMGNEEAVFIETLGKRVIHLFLLTPNFG